MQIEYVDVSISWPLDVNGQKYFVTHPYNLFSKFFMLHGYIFFWTGQSRILRKCTTRKPISSNESVCDQFLD